MLFLKIMRWYFDIYFMIQIKQVKLVIDYKHRELINMFQQLVLPTTECFKNYIKTGLLSDQNELLFYENQRAN